jgi:hypothetical protein
MKAGRIEEGTAPVGTGGPVTERGKYIISGVSKALEFETESFCLF